MERDESDSLGGEEESDYLSSDDEVNSKYSVYLKIYISLYFFHCSYRQSFLKGG